MTDNSGGYKVECPYCGYEWKARTEKPKKCPMCQKWLPPWKEVKK